MNLSDDQQKRIEENRAKALFLRQQRQNNPYISGNGHHIESTSSQSTIKDNNALKQQIEESRRNAIQLRASKASQNILPKENTDPSNQDILKQIAINRENAIRLRESKQSEKSITSEEERTTPVSQKPGVSLPYNGPVHIATCVLQTSNRFSISTKFHSQLMAEIKQMKTRSYESELCKWSLDCAEHDSFLKRTNYLQPQVKINPLPKFILSCLSKQKRFIPEISSTNCLLSKLLPFQKTGVQFVLSLEGKALLADDMGLGKTIQALCVMEEYRKEWPVLVICPSSLRLTWAEAFTSWLGICEEDINVLLKGLFKGFVYHPLNNNHISQVVIPLVMKRLLLSVMTCYQSSM